MPSRKSEASESNSSRRSSMRRLSSLASLHALNPFSRRRSANNVNGTPSSTSLASLASLALTSSSPVPEPSPTDRKTPAAPSIGTRPPLTQSSSRSYMCLDDPIGGMPRSRTFSNLPVPISRTKTRLPSALVSPSKTSPPPVRRKLSRSDTEPLLQATREREGRSTAFKENISLSPIRVPSIDLLENKGFYGSMLPSRSYVSTSGRESPSGSRRVQQHLARRERRQSHIAATTADKRASFHGDIKQNRLLTAIQAPSPPLPTTPLRQSFSEQVARIEAPNTRSRAQSIKKPAGSIFQAETPAYWTGRFSSLNDRYRNEELHASLTGPKHETDKMHATEATNARMRRAVEHLWYQCGSDEAKQSFVRWQKQLASAMNVPELGKPVGDSASVKSCALEMSLKSSDVDANGPPSSGSRRFMDKIWKKGKLLGSAA